MSFRKACRRLHVWLGVPLSLLLLVISISGVALIYYVEIDELLLLDVPVTNTSANTHTVNAHTANSHQAKNWDAAINTLRQHYPNKKGPWRFEANLTASYISARYYNPEETKNRFSFAPMIVWLTVDGKQIIKQTFWGDTPMTWLYNLHFQLLSGDVGLIIVGFIGIASLLMLLSGLIIWWPKKGQIKKAFQFKKRKHIIGQLYDWHKTLGYLSFIPLFVICLTGVMMVFPSQSNALLEQVAGEVRKPVKHPFDPSNYRDANPISLKLASIIAKQSIGKGKLAWIETSSSINGIYRFRFQVEGDPSARFPHSYIEVNSFTGEVVSLFDIRQQSTANKINNWLHPLHDGSIFGNYSKVTWLLFGIMMTLLIALGFYRWLFRIRKSV